MDADTMTQGNGMNFAAYSYCAVVATMTNGIYLVGGYSNYVSDRTQVFDRPQEPFQLSLDDCKYQNLAILAPS